MNDEEEGDSEVIEQCLRAAADGPFFPDWEFTILFGFERDEVRRIAECWPNWGDEAEQARAVDAAMKTCCVTRTTGGTDGTTTSRRSRPTSPAFTRGGVARTTWTRQAGATSTV